jgi:vacuolar protein sorting-associated protein 13A/C
MSLFDQATCHSLIRPHVTLCFVDVLQVIVEPLAVPAATEPLTRVDRFGCMWSSHGPLEGWNSGQPYATAGAGGVDVVGSDKGVTIWRPQPPMGYAIVGDVLSAGELSGGVMFCCCCCCCCCCL